MSSRETRSSALSISSSGISPIRTSGIGAGAVLLDLVNRQGATDERGFKARNISQRCPDSRLLPERGDHQRGQLRQDCALGIDAVAAGVPFAPASDDADPLQLVALVLEELIGRSSRRENSVNDSATCGRGSIWPRTAARTFDEKSSDSNSFM